MLRCGVVHLSAGALRDQRGWVLGPLGLEFQAVVTVVSHLTRVLGTEVRSSARAVPALNCCAIFPAPLLAHTPFIAPSGEIHSVPVKQGQTQSQGALLP